MHGLSFSGSGHPELKMGFETFLHLNFLPCLFGFPFIWRTLRVANRSQLLGSCNMKEQVNLQLLVFALYVLQKRIKLIHYYRKIVDVSSRRQVFLIQLPVFINLQQLSVSNRGKKQLLQMQIISKVQLLLNEMLGFYAQKCLT